MPSWAIMATRVHSAVVNAALQATTPNVVLAPGRNLSSASSRDSSGAGLPISAWASGGFEPPNSPFNSNGHAQYVAPSGISADPTEFTATMAPTVSPPPKSIDADPTPPSTNPAMAPRPAPTDPKAKSGPAACKALAPRARYGGSSPHVLSPPLPRSCSTAAGTMGMAGDPARNANPMPWAERAAVTPSAAARPNTDPPASTTACARPTRFSGASASVSRVPGPPPRTSTPAAQPL